MFSNYTKKPYWLFVLFLLGFALVSNSALAERILVIGGDTGNQATNDIIANQVSGLTGTVDRAEWLVYREWSSEYIINNYDVIVLSHIINESLFAIDWRTRLKPFLHSGKAIIWEAPMNLSTDIRADYGIDVRGAFYVPGGVPTTGLNVLPGADPVLINSLGGDFSGVDGMFLAWDNSLLTRYINTFYAATGETFTYALYGEFGGGRIVITGTADDDAGLSTGTAAQQNHYQHLVNKLLWVGGRTGIPDPNAVIIPDWRGLTEADAIAAVNNLLGKSPDFMSTIATNLYPSGTVSLQQPNPGSAAMANDPNPVFVSLTVVAQRTGDPVTVPNVTGMTSYAEVDDALDAADGALDGQGLYRYCCPSTYNPTVPDGTIITQYPKAGAQSTTDWLVDVVMSLGPNPGFVPGLMWMTQAEAESTVAAAGYTVGQIILQNNEAIDAGIVLGQVPEQHDALAAGSTVDIIVSAGPVGTELITVPDVAGLTQAAAEAAIAGAGLNSSATTAFSDTVPVGVVISQTPAAGTDVASGSVVSLVVSAGPAPVTIPVPDVAGLTQAAAETVITDAGLIVGNVSTANSDTVPAGNIISQTPTAATEVAPDSTVDLVVSTGPATVFITVPDVVGLTQAAAENVITNAGLVVGTVTTASSATVPAGEVISQTPAAAIDVAAGSAVDLLVSTGPALVSVPGVVGVSQANAEAAISSAGLSVGSVTTASSTTVPAGDVISQTPGAGAEVTEGSSVDLVVSTGSALITVPNVVGLSYNTAITNITNAGLTVGNVSTVRTRRSCGRVNSQTPSGGTSVQSGTQVDLVVTRTRFCNPL